MRTTPILIEAVFYSLVTSCIIGTAIMVKLNFFEQEKARDDKTKTHAR